MKCYIAFASMTHILVKRTQAWHLPTSFLSAQGSLPIVELFSGLIDPVVCPYTIWTLLVLPYQNPCLLHILPQISLADISWDSEE